MSAYITTIIDPTGDHGQTLAMELLGDSHEIRCVTSLAELGPALRAQTRLAICPAEMVRLLPGRLEDLLPQAELMTWCHKVERWLFEWAAANPRLNSILAWEAGQATPRYWELGMVSRRRIRDNSDPLDPSRVVPRNALLKTWKIRTTGELHQCVEDVSLAVTQNGGNRRIATRVAGVAHEMLMNALYDAPVDEQGRPLHAHDRTAKIKVKREDAVHLSFWLDDTSVFVQVRDRFGGLRRDHLFASIRRGFRSADSDAQRGDFIDSSHGGAGLGLHRIVTDANACVFDIRRSYRTQVTAYFDLQQPNRAVRQGPRSLHFFESSGAG